MAQGFKAVSTFAKDSSLVPSPGMVTKSYTSSLRWIQCTLLASTGTRHVHTFVVINTIYIKINQTFFKERGSRVPSLLPHCS